jgi:hypothetical protein
MAGTNERRQPILAPIMLSQLGASVALNQRIERACRHLFESALCEHGQFGISGTPVRTRLTHSGVFFYTNNPLFVFGAATLCLQLTGESLIRDAVQTVKRI